MNPEATAPPATTEQPPELPPEGAVYAVATHGGETGLVLTERGEFVLVTQGQGLGIRLSPARLRGLSYAMMAQAARQEQAKGTVDPAAPLWTSEVQGNA